MGNRLMTQSLDATLVRSYGHTAAEGRPTSFSTLRRTNLTTGKACRDHVAKGRIGIASIAAKDATKSTAKMILIIEVIYLN